MPVYSTGSGSSSGGALGWACRPMTCGTALPDFPPGPPDGQLGHVERVEDQLDLPADQERVNRVLVALEADGGGLADQPDRAPAERLAQHRWRPAAAAGPAAAYRWPAGLPGLGMGPLVVDLADPVIEQVVELVQAGDRVPGRVGRPPVTSTRNCCWMVSNTLSILPRPIGRPGWLWVSLMPSTAQVRASEASAKQEPLSVYKTEGTPWRGDRGAQHAGEPDRVRAADELVPGQEPDCDHR